tara:strand:- start:106 stop:390 length:285 start_codon:yes stop_codon:yes gene_type:complete
MIRYFVGEFKRSEDADYDFLEHTQMCDQLGQQLIDDMLEYSDRAWKTYGNPLTSKPSYYMHVQVYCEFSNEKHAVWFNLKYPQIKTMPSVDNAK